MELILILLIWLVAPFVELGIIIALAVKNNRQKAKIAQLTEWLKQQNTAYFEDASREEKKHGEEPDDAQPCPEAEPRTMAWVMPGGKKCVPKALAQDQLPWAAKSSSSRFREPDQDSNREPDRDSGFYRGTAALIIGVVFVVLAGLIFATTTWHILPGYCKVIMALGFSALFFGVSCLAGMVLKIKRTSRAFYILGSVFLFLTVLAGGYFGLLGPEFIMKGENRWRVLWAGSIVTEAALFAGLKSFGDRIYVQACLWGMTVSMTFLMGAFGLGYEGGVNAMVFYSFLLVVWNEIRRRKGEHTRQSGVIGGFPTEMLDEGFRTFAPLHFWIFSMVTGFWAAWGFMGRMTGSEIIAMFPITPWSTMAVGLTAAGVTIIALRHRNQGMKVLHSISLALFIQYAGFCVPVDFPYQIMIGAALTGIWFLAERRKDLPLANVVGGYVFTAVLCLDTLFLVFTSLFLWNEPWEQVLISGIILLLAVVADWWGRQYKAMRGMVPWVLFFLTVTVWKALNQGLHTDIRYDLVLLAYVLCIGIWDIVKSDHFQAAVLAVGTGAQIVFWLVGWETLPFCVLLSAYLFLKSQTGEMPEKAWHIKGGCLYFLAGIFILADNMTGNGVLKMMLVTGVYAVGYAVWCYRDRDRIYGGFRDFTGALLFLITIGAYYLDSQLKLWNLALCLGSFAGFYLMFYHKGRTWLNLAAVLTVIPVPWVVYGRYDVPVNQLYGWVGAALLVTGSLFRCYRPIIRKRDTSIASWDIDWFHILFILAPISMAWFGSREWRFAYTVLAGLYVLQYISLECCRRKAFTLALALGVLAFWQQPFVEWPARLGLEIQLLPAALFTWLLAFIWKNETIIPNLQTVLYCLCLGAMVLNAFFTGNVEDALILEALCLLVFIWAHIRRCVRWVRISGMIAVAAALYMTKGFWLSLSWWVYLLAAGIGLIIFAAANEMKKH